MGSKNTLQQRFLFLPQASVEVNAFYWTVVASDIDNAGWEKQGSISM